MEDKIYREHRWVHTQGNRRYNVIVRTFAHSTGLRTYGQPLIDVLIDGRWAGEKALSGDPDISDADARQYVKENFEDWLFLLGLDE